MARVLAPSAQARPLRSKARVPDLRQEVRRRPSNIVVILFLNQEQCEDVKTKKKKTSAAGVVVPRAGAAKHLPHNANAQRANPEGVDPRANLGPRVKVEGLRLSETHAERL